MSYSTWPLSGVHSRGTRVKLNHGCPLPLSWLDLLKPLTSWELEEKPSSLRLVLSLVVGLSAEATGPISLWDPLCVSFCFLASFLWDMCKGKNHSQMVPVALKHWEDQIALPPDPSSSIPKPGSDSRNRVQGEINPSPPEIVSVFHLLRNMRFKWSLAFLRDWAREITHQTMVDWSKGWWLVVGESGG